MTPGDRVAPRAPETPREAGAMNFFEDSGKSGGPQASIPLGTQSRRPSRVEFGEESSPPAAGLVDGHSLLSGQFHRNGRLLFRLAVRLVKDGATAEDMFQAVFLKALEQKVQPDGLGGWLAATIRNECLQLLRRKEAERRALQAHASRGARK